MTAGKILIIDDSSVVLDRLRETLTRAGWQVVTSTQTVGAARHLRSCHLAAIDFHMPGIDGGSVAASLRAAVVESGATCPPLYLYTSDEAVARRASALGFDGAFTSKGDDDAFVQQAAAALRLARLRALSTTRRSRA